MFYQIRMWAARKICPDDFRLVEVGDVVSKKSTVISDLIHGGDALDRGWGCHPAILYNAAAFIERATSPENDED